MHFLLPRRNNKPLLGIHGMSYEQFIELFDFLIHSFSLVVLFALILGRIIVNYPGLFFESLSYVVDCVGKPLDILVNILQSLALRHLLIWIVHQITSGFSNSKSISYGKVLFVLGCILLLIISPQRFSLEGILLIVLLLLVLIFKIIIIVDPNGKPTNSEEDINNEEELSDSNPFNSLKIKKLSNFALPDDATLWAINQAKNIENITLSATVRAERFEKIAFRFMNWAQNIEKTTLSAINRAERFEKIAFRAYESGKFVEALSGYQRALKVYKTPLLLKDNNLDIRRAKLIEKIGILLYEDEQLKRALTHLNQALDIYEKLLLAKQSIVMNDYTRVLMILRQIGGYDEVLKRRYRK